MWFLKICYIFWRNTDIFDEITSSQENKVLSTWIFLGKRMLHYQILNKTLDNVKNDH